MSATDKEKKVKGKTAAQKKKEKERRESKLLAKKPYIEFITAILSIPVLITVIILNFTNLQNLGKSKVTPTPTPPASTGTVNSNGEEIQPTSPGCKEEIGPITINSPQEGDTLSDNPVTITISHDDTTYCPILWSYRLNGGNWSAYDNNPIALYNLKQGDVNFELRVKSQSSSDTETLTRSFTYEGNKRIEPPQDDNPASDSGN